MAKIVSPINARVEVIGKLKESAYQEGQYYRSVLFIDLNQPGGSDEAKIWKSLSESECEGLVKGATVQLVPAGRDKNGNDKHNIVLLEGDRPITPTPTTAVPSDTGWTLEQKKVIAAQVNQHADLLRYCLETSRSKFGDLVESEESFRALATTIFISALRESR